MDVGPSLSENAGGGKVINLEPRYLRMIRGMKKSGRRDWSVYILRCGDGTFYTGIAKDVETRVTRHSRGKGGAYTRTHLPVKLLYQEGSLTHSQALVREARVKTWPRSQKKKFIRRNKNGKSSR